MHLAGLRDATEITEGRAPCLLRGKPLLHVLGCRLRQMAGDLVVDVALHLPGANERRQPEKEHAQPYHEDSSEIFRKRSTILAARCHCASSLWSCLRPARVRV